MTAYRIFTQAPEGKLDVVRLLVQARTFFEASVEVISVSDDDVVRLSLESRSRGHAGRFAVHQRPVTEKDLEDACAAEERGRAAGMSALATRCAYVWELATEGDVPLAATLNLCALLASLGLGPVLPPDAETLFGVRGAMERVERLSGGPTLAR